MEIDVVFRFGRGLLALAWVALMEFLKKRGPEVPANALLWSHSIGFPLR